MADLGWGAGGMEEAMQLVQALQTGKIEQQQKQVALEGSQLQLENMKKLQSALASGQFQGLSSQDPTEHTKAMTDLANTYLANGMPEQAKNIADMANNSARTSAEVTERQATTALAYIDTAQKLFAGVTTPDEWHAAQQLMQAELPPDALKNPAIKGILTSQFDPSKVRIMPEFLERMKQRAQIALDKANTLRANAETQAEDVRGRVEEEQIRLDKVREDYLRAQGAWNEETEGNPEGDKMSQLRYLVTQGNIQLPLGSRSSAARNQFFRDAVKNNPDMSAEEIFEQIREGYVGMKGTLTEAGKIAQREANITSAQAALTEQGGLYDSLQEAAGKINFDDDKVKTQIRNALQRHIYANPDIQAYATYLEDTRAELGTVLSRSGQLTDVARAQAARALPDTMSKDELAAAITASRRATAAVMSGNKAVMDALKQGKSLEEAVSATSSPAAGTPSFATEAAAAAARKIGKIKPGDKIIVGGQTGVWQD